MGFDLRSITASRGEHSASTQELRLSGEEADALESQINIPPVGHHRLWKVISAALRCPACGSIHHKAQTGKRTNADGLLEQYRHCESCGIRFRAVFE